MNQTKTFFKCEMCGVKEQNFAINPNRAKRKKFCELCLSKRDRDYHRKRAEAKKKNEIQNTCTGADTAS